ncbi:MAG: nucleoid-associated protein [Verrucomicrobiota bacterium]
MTLKLTLDDVRIAGLVLAKVGNPSRDEPLKTSKKVLQVGEDDQPLLSSIFLRPFRGLGMQGQRFHHHSSLEKHEINACAAAIFGEEDGLLERGCEIAKRLYSKSGHPNIKSGDLCMALIEGIVVEGEKKRALCVLKSESVTPFLSILDRDGDLRLSTEQGINPEKIDKGCLILDHFAAKGYYVLTFDRAGNESRFWVRDFLGVVPISDAGLMTKKVAELAMSAVSGAGPTVDDDSPPWEVNAPAQEALAYFDGRKKFSLQEFEEQALRTPEARERFAAERRRLEDDEGVRVEDAFEISKRDVAKAKKGMKSLLRLDSGVEIKLKPKVVEKPDAVLEKGYDEERGMRFIKVFYKEEI